MLITMLLFTANAIASGFGEYEMRLWIKVRGTNHDCMGYIGDYFVFQDMGHD